MQSPPKIPPAQLQQLRQQASRDQLERSPENMLRQQQAAAGVKKGDPSIDAVKSLVNPQSWMDQLLGVPESSRLDAHQRDTEKAMKQSDQNHTPLDLKKLGEKHDAGDLAKARQQFQWFRSEQDRVINDNKRHEQEKAKAEAEAEQRKKQEAAQASQNADSGDEPTGKQKGRLGQPRRKATTEKHPETKMGGTK
ncbi:MAG: hypothetical protein WCO78_05225 [Candidatus Roizmanbacteria bacterium]